MTPEETCEHAIVVTVPGRPLTGDGAKAQRVYVPCGEGWNAAPSLAAVLGAEPAARQQRARARSAQLRRPNRRRARAAR